MQAQMIAALKHVLKLAGIERKWSWRYRKETRGASNKQVRRVEQVTHLVGVPDKLELLDDLGALVQFQDDTCRADAERGHVVGQALERDEAGVGGRQRTCAKNNEVLGVRLLRFVSIEPFGKGHEGGNSGSQVASAQLVRARHASD